MKLVYFLIIIFFAGCSKPLHLEPLSSPQESWSLPQDESSPKLVRWWETYNDASLNRLINEALEQNLDIQRAKTRLIEARSLYEGAVGRKSPTLDAKSSVAQKRRSENGELPIGKLPAMKRDISLFEAGFDASWELDIFGRIDSSVKQASAKVDEVEANIEAVKLSIITEIAKNYFELRFTQNEKKLHLQKIEILKKELNAIEIRFKNGDTSNIELENEKTKQELAKSALPNLEAKEYLFALRIALLLGKNPESELGLLQEEAQYFAPALFPVGKRADLLLRRADIKAAKHRFEASLAELKVAQAEWFPKLIIGSTIGFQAQHLEDTFKSGSLLAGIIPTLSWRIFDGGRIEAQINVSDARLKESALAYHQAVLSALNEAESALYNYHFALKSIESYQNILNSTSSLYTMVNRRFKLGDISLLEKLDASKNELDAQISLLNANRSAILSMLSLYKSLGGGWEEKE